MNRRRCIFSLVLVLIAGSVHAEQECEVALNKPPEFNAPAPIDPESRAPEVFGQMLEVIQRDPNVAGTNNAMLVLNGEIRPVLDAVATYLQSRENYPGGFSQGPSTELATTLFTELSTRLDALKANRDDAVATPETRWDWMSFRNVPVARRADDQSLKVRYLHFALNFAAEKLAADVKKWPAALTRTNLLRERMREVAFLLDRVEERIDVETSDWTFKLRLKSLIDDVRNQNALLEGVHESIEKRIQWANAILDDIRTLLVVRLSLEAVMGSQPLDLSPLEPPDFAAAPSPVEDVAPSSPEMAEAITSIIRAAQNMTDFAASREVLLKFVTANSRALTVNQAIKLATCIANSDHTTNLVLMHFVNLRKASLSQNDLLRLANEARNDSTKQSIIANITNTSPGGSRGALPPPKSPGRRGVL